MVCRHTVLYMCVFHNKLTNISYERLWITRIQTRSSATAEKQRVSCTCLPVPGLANRLYSAQNARRMSEVVLAYYLTFKRSDQEVLAENGF